MIYPHVRLPITIKRKNIYPTEKEEERVYTDPDKSGDASVG